jgi:hypothetical protein
MVVVKNPYAIISIDRGRRNFSSRCSHMIMQHAGWLQSTTSDVGKAFIFFETGSYWASLCSAPTYD